MDIINIAKEIQNNLVVDVISHMNKDIYRDLPLYISQELGKDGKVVVAKPNKLSVNIDYKNAIELQSEQLISINDGYSPINTQLTYMKCENLMDYMSKYYNNAPKDSVAICDLIVISGNLVSCISSELLMFIWRSLGEKGYIMPRLLILRGSDEPLYHLENITCKRIEVDRKKIKKKFTDKNISFKDRAAECANVVSKYHFMNKLSERDTSVWMVVAPSNHDIKIVMEKLKEYDDIEIIALLSLRRKDDEDEKKIMRDPPQGKRRIIITGDIGLTLTHNVECVFDTMIRKRGNKYISATLDDSKISDGYATKLIWKCVENDNIERYRLMVSINDLLSISLKLINMKILPNKFLKSLCASENDIRKVESIIDDFNIITVSKGNVKLTNTGKKISLLTDHFNIFPVLVLCKLLEIEEYVSINTIKSLLIIENSKKSGRIDEIINNFSSSSDSESILLKKSKTISELINTKIEDNNKVSKYLCDAIKDIYKYSNLLKYDKTKKYYRSTFDDKIWKFRPDKIESVKKTNNGKIPNSIYLIRGDISKLSNGFIFNEIKIYL